MSEYTILPDEPEIPFPDDDDIPYGEPYDEPFWSEDLDALPGLDGEVQDGSGPPLPPKDEASDRAEAPLLTSGFTDARAAAVRSAERALMQAGADAEQMQHLTDVFDGAAPVFWSLYGPEQDVMTGPRAREIAADAAQRAAGYARSNIPALDAECYIRQPIEDMLWTWATELQTACGRPPLSGPEPERENLPELKAEPEQDTGLTQPGNKDLQMPEADSGRNVRFMQPEETMAQPEVRVSTGGARKVSEEVSSRLPPISFEGTGQAGYDVQFIDKGGLPTGIICPAADLAEAGFEFFAKDRIMCDIFESLRIVDRASGTVLRDMSTDELKQMLHPDPPGYDIRLYLKDGGMQTVHFDTYAEAEKHYQETGGLLAGAVWKMDMADPDTGEVVKVTQYAREPEGWTAGQTTDSSERKEKPPRQTEQERPSAPTVKPDVAQEGPEGQRRIRQQEQFMSLPADGQSAAVGDWAASARSRLSGKGSLNAFLSMWAHFPSRTPRNALAMFAQNPALTDIRTAEEWKAAGYQLKDNAPQVRWVFRELGADGKCGYGVAGGYDAMDVWRPDGRVPAARHDPPGADKILASLSTVLKTPARDPKEIPAMIRDAVRQSGDRNGGISDFEAAAATVLACRSLAVEPPAESVKALDNPAALRKLAGDRYDAALKSAQTHALSVVSLFRDDPEHRKSHEDISVPEPRRSGPEQTTEHQGWER